MTCFDVSSRHLRRESGAIMILTALVIVALFVMLALALDSSIIYSNRTEDTTTAGEAALAALETYGAMPVGTPYSERIQKAKARAREIVALAMNRTIGNVFLEEQGPPQNILCFEHDPSGDCSDPEKINGYIYPGRYHFSEPAIGCANYSTYYSATCPCSGSGHTWGGSPCFERNDPSAGPDMSASAFQVTLGTQSGNAVRTQFGHVVGQDTLETTSVSTATIIPRHAVFLVDISPSTIRDNNLTNSEHLADVSWKLNAAVNTCADGTQVCQSPGICVFASPPQNGKYNYFNGSLPYNQMHVYNDRALYSPTDFDPPGPVTTDPRFAEYHFKDDYVCRVPTYKQCDGCTNDNIGSCGACVDVTDYYLVDEYRSAVYQGPEPLNSILNGVNVALEVFESRGVAGDRVAAYFFDSSTDIFQPTYPNGTHMRRYPLGPIGEDSFDQLKLASDVTWPGPNNPSQQVRRMLYPRAHTYTNLPGALTLAMNVLDEAQDADDSENMVIVFTDGRTTCVSGVCDNTWAYHQGSLNQAMSIIADRFVPSRVALHMIVIGNSSGQHTLLRKNGDGTCMDDGEARAGGFSFTDQDFDGTGLSGHNYGAPNDFQDQWNGQQSGDIPYFFFPNQMYDFSQLTNGIWSPIRKCCDGACSESATSYGALCSGGTKGDLVTGGGSELGGINGSNLDGEGRVLCDTRNISPRKQIKDTIENIMNKSPFLLIGPDD